MYERQGDGNAPVAIEQLCAALIGDSPGQAKAYVARLLACGIGVETLYDTFIPGAAARLGEMWVEDTLSFTQVTLGMARLTEVFRGLSPMFMKTGRPVSRGRRALFALVPGEEHALGVVIAADHFQRAGWTVQVELQSSLAGLVDAVREQPFDLVGLSAGSRRIVPTLERTLARLRAVASPSTRFAVGGAVLSLEPDLIERLGVDIDGSSAKEALYDMELST